MEDSSSNGIVRNSGHIISEGEFNYVQWNFNKAQGPYIFPFGYSNTDYLPFTVDKTSNDSNRIAVSTYGTNSQNTPRPFGVTNMKGAGDSLTSAIDRFWIVRRLGWNGSLTANFTFSYRGAENTVTNPTTSILQSQMWDIEWLAQSPGGSLGVTTGVGTTTGTQTIGSQIKSYPFVLSRAGFPLPVDLLSFKASWQSDKEQVAQLNWRVASSKEVDFFAVIRSLDGVNYDSVGLVDVRDGFQLKFDYQDESIPKDAAEVYYKIITVGYNGERKMSSFRMLTRSHLSPLSIILYPNPFKNQVELNFTHVPKGELILEIYDTKGSKVFTNNIRNQEQYYKLLLPNLADGTYTLIIGHQGNRHQFKLQKLN